MKNLGSPSWQHAELPFPPKNTPSIFLIDCLPLAFLPFV